MTPLRQRTSAEASEIVDQVVGSGVFDVPARLARRAKIHRALEPLLADELERRAQEYAAEHRRPE